MIKIAHIGLRGIPARYGGIENFVEEIATLFAKNGWQIYVYSRNSNIKYNAVYKNVHIINIPIIKIKLFETVVHSFISAIDALKRNINVIHLHSYMSYFVIPLLKAFGKKVIVTLHGAAWKNISYGFISRFLTKLFAILGIFLADAATAVSLPFKHELEAAYKRTIILTPIGMPISKCLSACEIIDKFGLKENDYILFLGRLEKVKRIDWLIEAYIKINPPFKLVIAGDTNDFGYKLHIKNLAVPNKNIVFTGYVTGSLKAELFSNCRFFVLPSSVEGMPVAILEAVSYKKLCFVSDISVNKWLIEHEITGYLFNTSDFNDFLKKLNFLLSLDIYKIKKIGESAYENFRERFRWDKTIKQLYQLYYTAAEHKGDR